MTDPMPETIRHRIEAIDALGPKPPNPGVRIAFACPKKDCNHRKFNQPSWVCPDHGVSKRQENHPYFGQSTK
jgi:hypothetical protein